METEFASVDNGRWIRSGAPNGTNYHPSHWAIVPVGGDLYSFVNRNSGRCLDVPHAFPGIKVVQWACHGGANQQFFLENASSPGHFHIRASNASADMILEVGPPDPPEESPRIQQGFRDGGLNQEFWFEPV